MKSFDRVRNTAILTLAALTAPPLPAEQAFAEMLLPQTAQSATVQSLPVKEGPVAGKAFTEGLSAVAPGLKGCFMVTGPIHPGMRPFLENQNGGAWKENDGRQYLNMRRFLSEYEGTIIMPFSMKLCHAEAEHVANWAKVKSDLAQTEAGKNTIIMFIYNSGPRGVNLANNNKIPFIIDTDLNIANSLIASASGHVLAKAPGANGKLIIPQKGSTAEVERKGPNDPLTQNVFDCGKDSFKLLGDLMVRGWNPSGPVVDSGAGKIFADAAKRSTIASACILPPASESDKRAGGKTQF